MNEIHPIIFPLRRELRCVVAVCFVRFVFFHLLCGGELLRCCRWCSFLSWCWLLFCSISAFATLDFSSHFHFLHECLTASSFFLFFSPKNWSQIGHQNRLFLTPLPLPFFDFWFPIAAAAAVWRSTATVWSIFFVPVYGLKGCLVSLIISLEDIEGIVGPRSAVFGKR